MQRTIRRLFALLPEILIRVFSLKSAGNALSSVNLQLNLQQSKEHLSSGRLRPTAHNAVVADTAREHIYARVSRNSHSLDAFKTA